MKSLLILGAFISLFAMSFGGEADSGEHIVDVDDLSEDLTKDLGSDAEDFKKFNKKFNKRIKKKDFGKAAAAFKKNNKKLKALQEKHKGEKFTFKMNRFMALPEEEFKENVLLSPRAMKFNKNTRAIDRKKAKELRQAKRKSKQEARKAARMAKRKERLGAKKAGKLVQEKVLRKGKKNHKREAEQEVTTEETTTPEWTVVYEYDDGTTEEEPYDPRIDNKLPEQFDWRDYGVITPVKDQGSCGSCWTFSAIGVLEAQHARKHPGELLDLSEQQIITCVSLDRENICKGGASENVFEYFMNASLVSETEQPYAPSKLIAPRDAGCKKVTKPLVKVASHISLLGSTVDEIKDALIQDGPISVGAYLNDEFDYWGGGIFTVPCTEANTGGHAMLIVGYGKEDGIPYWIIRNSWGTDWGENGYIRWKMGEDLCNVESRRLNQAQIV